MALGRTPSILGWNRITGRGTIFFHFSSHYDIRHLMSEVTEADIQTQKFRRCSKAPKNVIQFTLFAHVFCGV